ncbi:hypothetical protein O3P69_001087 [Scylla paramamosain]|uniref:Uncharacterized protein n=1 Tax=Scylla paramamosain TaxID=85552 RepID=A0AAW0UNI8_SCYPA
MNHEAARVKPSSEPRDNRPHASVLRYKKSRGRESSGREQVAEITLAGGVSCDTAYPALRNPYVEEQWEDKGRRAARSAVPPQSHLKPPEEDADGSEVDAPQCCTKQAFSVSLEGSEP